MELKGKTVVITGGSRGIGKTVAMMCADEGANIAVIATTEEEVNKTVDELKAKGAKALGIVFDVRHLDDMSKAARIINKELGGADVLINNAGILNWNDFLKLEPEKWEKEVAVNFLGVLNCTYAFVPGMLEKKDGVVVNISSGAGKRGHPRMATYSATKFAVLGFTEAFSAEVDNGGVRVYAVCPGTTKTEMTGYVGMEPEKVAKRIMATIKEELDLTPGEATEIYG